MKHYSIAFVGLGSIAKRHIKNLVSFLNERGDKWTIDLYRSTARPLPEDISPFVNSVYQYSEIVPSTRKYNVVFITNPSSLHYEALERFCNNTDAFFIEKPIFESALIDKSIFDRLGGVICYVACPLRYNSVIRYIRENVNLHNVMAARAISSSFLPEWRAGIDYRDTYSAHKDLGGGVGLDLIHEWDYLTWLFGFPIAGYSIRTRVSDLDIDCDDLAIYIAQAGNTAIEIHLDYFGRKNIRSLELFTKEDTIRCDILNGTVSYLREGRVIDMKEDRDSFQMREMRHFFDIIDNKTTNDSTPEQALRVLQLAQGDF